MLFLSKFKGLTTSHRHFTQLSVARGFATIKSKPGSPPLNVNKNVLTQEQLKKIMEVKIKQSKASQRTMTGMGESDLERVSVSLDEHGNLDV